MPHHIILCLDRIILATGLRVLINLSHGVSTMEQMGQESEALNMNYTKIGLIAALITFSILDVVTTLIAKYTLPYLNETSPIVTAGGSIWGLILVKMVVVFYLGYWCLTKYSKKINVYIRYFIIYIIVMLVFMNLFVGIHNASILALPDEVKDQIQPMPKEQKEQYYKDRYRDLRDRRKTGTTDIQRRLRQLHRKTLRVF